MTLPKKLYTVRELQEVLGASRTVLFNLMRDGRLKRVKLGAKTLVTAESVAAFVAELSEGKSA